MDDMAERFVVYLTEYPEDAVRRGGRTDTLVWRSIETMSEEGVRRVFDATCTPPTGSSLTLFKEEMLEIMREDLFPHLPKPGTGSRSS